MSSLNTTELRLISFDLDDTLLNSRKEISDNAVKQIRRLQVQGNIIVLNSGRFSHEIEPYAKQLQLDRYGGYMISANGHTIINSKDHTTYSFPDIQKDDVQKLLKQARELHLACYFHDEEGYHFYANVMMRWLYRLHISFVSCLRALSKRPPLHPFDPKPYPHSYVQPLQKLCLIGFPVQLQAMVHFTQTQCPQYHHFYVNRLSKEIVHASISKKEAVRYICELHGYTMKQVLAFGDSGNDIPLLQHAGIGVAMKNALPEVKQQCSYVSAYSNNEDGVAKELLRLFPYEKHKQAASNK